MVDESRSRVYHARLAGEAALDHQLVRPLNWQLARVLFGLLLPVFSCLAVTVTNQMVTKAVSTSRAPFPRRRRRFSRPTKPCACGSTSPARMPVMCPLPLGIAEVERLTILAVGIRWHRPVAGASGYPWLSPAIRPHPLPAIGACASFWNGSTLFSLNFTILAPAIPSISTGGVVNAASYASGAAVAPGSIASAFGSFLLNSPAGAASMPLPTNLSGLSMQFGGGTKVPLIYAANGQVNLPGALGS